MASLQLLLVLGLAVTFATALWGPEYREHAQCVANCDPDKCPNECSSNCVCYRRFDFPSNGYCMDPSKPIPEQFRNLGASK
uniref:TIL domain-containing protein n=1 Tax=Amblyomma maculatum TaxID=34609 RepID=G3MPU7_AMBMU